MNNKVCGNCGRANLPSSNICTNCGLNLPQMPESNFGNQEDPLKTIVVDEQDFSEIVSAQTSKSSKAGSKNTKSNNTLYWVLGGAGALVLVGGFMIVFLGIGIFLYANSGDDKIATKEDINRKTDEKRDNFPKENPAKRETSSAQPRTSMGREILKMLNDEYASFGKFKLIKTEVKVLKTFDLADETLIGIYSEQGSSAEIIHSYSYYSSWRTAKRQATQKFYKFKKNDRKATIKSKRKNLIAVFTVSGRQYYMECGQAGKMGLCQLVSSDEPSQLRRYIDVRYK